MNQLQARSKEGKKSGSEGKKKRAAQKLILEFLRPSKTKSASKTLLPVKLKPVKPMLAVLTDAPFNDDEWVFEVKYDGFRAVTQIQAGKSEMYSRNLKSFNQNYPDLINELNTIKHTVIFDGEVVAENKKGQSVFQLLQNNAKEKIKGTLKYYVFDLLHLNGYDLYDVPLTERKKLLKIVLAKSKKLKHIHYSEHVTGKGISFYKKAVKKNLEGIMAKEAGSLYRTGKRSQDWLKIKISLHQEMIIIGITSPKGSRKYFGSLLLGYYEQGKLKYAGNCGTGFTQSTLELLYKKASNYFTDKPPVKEKISFPGEIQWIKPHLICQVKFTEWTSAGSLRHPVYLGLRNYKSAKEVIREKPTVHHTKK